MIEECPHLQSIRELEAWEKVNNMVGLRLLSYHDTRDFWIRSCLVQELWLLRRFITDNNYAVDTDQKEEDQPKQQAGHGGKELQEGHQLLVQADLLFTEQLAITNWYCIVKFVILATDK